jgi:hypothetical protein
MRPQDGKSAPITEMFVWNLLLLDYRTVLVQRFPRPDTRKVYPKKEPGFEARR